MCVLPYGFVTPHVIITIGGPGKTYEFLDGTITSPDNAFAATFALAGKGSLTVMFWAGDDKTWKVAQRAFLNKPAEIISNYQIKHRLSPTVLPKETEAPDSTTKLDAVLGALMKEDPRLADKLLGYPDQEVQDIALRNMKGGH